MTVHVVHFVASITPTSTFQLIDLASKAASAEGATELQVHISSDGGHTDDAFALYNFFKSLALPVAMHNIGNVESMAVIVYLAGSRRLAASNARFKIHSLHWGFDAGKVDHLRLKEFGASLDNDADRYVTLCDLETQGAAAPIPVREHLFGDALLLDAPAAVTAGLAHVIADPELPADAVHWWVTAH